MEELNGFLSLNDIISKATSKTISLPTVQRGFVWKPYQIENLWDSLLRGYPVGAFVLSKKINSEKEEYELLDGQQRASAICLGFYNPLNENTIANNQIFKTSNDNIMIFIDLEKPNSEIDNRKYIFRVITKSHPWGYRKNENQKILDTKDISSAMSSYQTENYDYLKKPLTEFWPFDSSKPIPIGLFINASINKLSLENLEIEIKKWKGKFNLNQMGDLEVIKRRDENKNHYSIKEIYNDVEKMFAKQKIPLLHLNLSDLYTNEANLNFETQKNANKKREDSDEDFNDEEKNELERESNEDRNIDEVENLFIRLNSGGTPLRGEELNYSILKSHIKNLVLLDNIEKKCEGLFYPARFITIVFRLFNNGKENSASEKDSISMKIKPKQFQRNMREGKKDGFVKYLENFLNTNILEESKKSLLYSETNKKGLPTFIAYSIADKAPEVMFMLLYRIYIKQDIITEELKPKVLGMITLFMWLGKGDKQRDHAKLLENIWPCVKDYDTEIFWSNETVQRAMIIDRDFEVLTAFPNLRELKKIIPQGQRITELTSNKVYNKTDYGSFISKMFYNKDLILYAQREALYKWFKEIWEFNLEDTNRAFDWDHICPNNYISGKQKIRTALKNWYSSNGNFRAWPYSLNRGDQTDAPYSKLNPKDELEWWSERMKEKYSTEKQLKEDILKKSFCDEKEKWLELDSNTKHSIKDDKTAKKILDCILNRNINICIEWYKQLEIEKLIPEKQKNVKSFFENIINQKMWKLEQKKNEDYYTYYLSIGEANISLYFSFYIDGNILNDDETEFGIYNENEKKLPKLKEDDKYYYINDSEKEYMYFYFTTMSYSERSKIILFKQFYQWLNNFPDKKIRDMAIEKFNNSIKVEFKNQICNSTEK